MNATAKKMTIDECLELCNHLLIRVNKRGLTDVEQIVIEGSWNKKTYQEIADEHCYEISYIQGDVGFKLWRSLSNALNVRVSKSNFRTQLQMYQGTIAHSLTDAEESVLPPERVLFRGTPVYIQRLLLEEKYCQAIEEKGALLRIRAPQKMGKSLLLEQVIQHGVNLGYQVVTIDFRLLEKPVLSNLKDFLQWLCFNVARDLEIEPQLDQVWADIGGQNKSFTEYFESYLLPQLDSPLILALDNVDALFTGQAVCHEFFRVLRSVHESAKRIGRRASMWQKLRLVVSYSTQDYPVCDINVSPLYNVGFARTLESLTLEQMCQCAQGYELRDVLTPEESLDHLHELLEGHPYLTQEAMSCVAEQQIGVSEFISLATTSRSPFRSYLSALLFALKHNEALSQAFKQVLRSDLPIAIPSPLNFHLESMGLLKQAQDEKWRVSNPLYRQFFQEHLDEF